LADAVGAYRAIAWMVGEGLTPPTVEKTDLSQIHKFGMSQPRQSGIDDAGARIVAHPGRAVEVTRVVFLNASDSLGQDAVEKRRAAGHRMLRYVVFIYGRYPVYGRWIRRSAE
jgi:hypothetical protein